MVLNKGASKGRRNKGAGSLKRTDLRGDGFGAVGGWIKGHTGLEAGFISNCSRGLETGNIGG